MHLENKPQICDFNCVFWNENMAAMRWFLIMISFYLDLHVFCFPLSSTILHVGSVVNPPLQSVDTKSQLTYLWLSASYRRQFSSWSSASFPQQAKSDPIPTTSGFALSDIIRCDFYDHMVLSSWLLLSSRSPQS